MTMTCSCVRNQEQCPYQTVDKLKYADSNVFIIIEGNEHPKMYNSKFRLNAV